MHREIESKLKEMRRIAGLRSYIAPDEERVYRPNVIVYAVSIDHKGECGIGRVRAHQFASVLEPLGKREKFPVSYSFGEVVVSGDKIISGLSDIDDVNEIYFDNEHDRIAKDAIKSSVRGRREGGMFGRGKTNIGRVGYVWFDTKVDGLVTNLKDLVLDDYHWELWVYDEEAGIWKPAEPAIKAPKEETVMVAK